MLVALSSGSSCGSLSGGCVEEDFLERLALGSFDAFNQVVRYGDGGLAPTIALPCEGALDVLLEYFAPDRLSINHFRQIAQALSGQNQLMRTVVIGEMSRQILPTDGKVPRVQRHEAEVSILVGPVKRLIIAGLSPVAEYCAGFAVTLGFEVIVCDPRPEEVAKASKSLKQVRVLEVLPAVFIEQGGCHAATAVVALTHDPRLDDLTLMESIRTEAFYIGAMGSARTSEKRLERLVRIAGLSESDKKRIHAPIGLQLGSKTPAEIAIAVMADILRVGNGIDRGCV